MLLRIAAVMVVTPFYILPVIIVTFLAGWISQIYMRAQLSIKREMSNARAPVLAHFGSAVAGIGTSFYFPPCVTQAKSMFTVSIRAYGAQEMFKLESCSRMDRYNRAGFAYDALSRYGTLY